MYNGGLKLGLVTLGTLAGAGNTATDTSHPLPSTLPSKLSPPNHINVHWRHDFSCSLTSPLLHQRMSLRSCAVRAGRSVTNRYTSQSFHLVVFIIVLWGPQTLFFQIIKFIDGFRAMKRMSGNRIKSYVPPLPLISILVHWLYRYHIDQSIWCYNTLLFRCMVRVGIMTNPLTGNDMRLWKPACLHGLLACELWWKEALLLSSSHVSQTSPLSTQLPWLLGNCLGP